MEKTVYFRFDIDTVACIREGVPALLGLARELGLQFTFFANMGKSISRREVLLHSPRRTLGNLMPPQGSKVSALSKLGVANVLRTVVFNPVIGAAHADMLDSILAGGHELSLHGGINHATWQRNADGWSLQQIIEQLHAVHNDFCRRYGMPTGFASPGGTGSAILYDYLHQLGYRYVSDHMRSAPTDLFTEPCGLRHIPVNLLIQQVPMVENLHARGLAPDIMLAEALQLVSTTALKTAVGHPCFEGKAGLPSLRRLCTTLLDRGYRFKAYRELPGLQ